MLERPLVRRRQTIPQRNARSPAEREDAGAVEEFSRRSVGFRAIPCDRAPIADHVAHRFCEIADRDLLPGASRVSPSSARVYRDSNEILTLFGRATVTPRVSIAPEETASTVLLTLAYAAAFAAAETVTTSVRRPFASFRPIGRVAEDSDGRRPASRSAD